ncbi:acyltransferase [Tetragenococcus halophilus]|uniref:acyltransferase n=1 Tax=Tetragenococcus halophilus TaxID=51669 RepID=UPI001F34C374|nr:acyltransferase [Tetragenococcus halophilus]MCF1686032.1 acyltransferase [Tetragenococcus halophilus]
MNTVRSLDEKEILKNNFIVANEENNIQFKNSKIIFKGENNYIFLDKDAQLVDTTVTFHGDNSVLYIGKTRNNKVQLKATLYHNSLIFFNEGCSFNKPLSVIASEAKDIIIGKDVMFSSGCWIRNSDVHMIYDEYQKRINESKTIFIGDHVWIGQDVSILKGSYIGSGAVIGLGSVVAKRIKSNSTNAGNPIKRIKENIFWDRQSAHFFVEKDTKRNKVYVKDPTSYLFKGNDNLVKWQKAISERPMFNNNFEIETFIKQLKNMDSLVVLNSITGEV